MITATENSIDFATLDNPSTVDSCGVQCDGLLDRLARLEHEYNACRMELLVEDSNFATAWQDLRTAHREVNGGGQISVPAGQRGSFSITLSMDHCAEFSVDPSVPLPHNPGWDDLIAEAVAAWRIAQTERHAVVFPETSEREEMVADFSQSWGLSPQYVLERLSVSTLQVALDDEAVEEEARASMEGAAGVTDYVA